MHYTKGFTAFWECTLKYCFENIVYYPIPEVHTQHNMYQFSKGLVTEELIITSAIYVLTSLLYNFYAIRDTNDVTLLKHI